MVCLGLVTPNTNTVDACLTERGNLTYRNSTVKRLEGGAGAVCAVLAASCASAVAFIRLHACAASADGFEGFAGPPLLLARYSASLHVFRAFVLTTKRGRDCAHGAM